MIVSAHVNDTYVTSNGTNGTLLWQPTSASMGVRTLASMWPLAVSTTMANAYHGKTTGAAMTWHLCSARKAACIPTPCDALAYGSPLKCFPDSSPPSPNTDSGVLPKRAIDKVIHRIQIQPLLLMLWKLCFLLGPAIRADHHFHHVHIHRVDEGIRGR